MEAWPGAQLLLGLAILAHPILGVGYSGGRLPLPLANWGWAELLLGISVHPRVEGRHGFYPCLLGGWGGSKIPCFTEWHLEKSEFRTGRPGRPTAATGVEEAFGHARANFPAARNQMI